MDNNILSLILQGCKLARELESNLLNRLPDDSLSDSCEQIIRVFSDVREQLNTIHVSESSLSFYSRAMATMALFKAQTPTQKLYIGGHASGTSDTASGQAETTAGVPAVGSFGGDQSMQTIMDASLADQANVTLAGASSSYQRQRRSVNFTGKRKEEGDRRKVQVAAPQFGNTDIPPEDGFTWKKYGQKEILGSLFPRSYYRCTHQKLYNCPAKKQVQRLDTNPFTYEVTYRGFHSCHLSSTAPTVPPLHPSSSLPNMGQWLSMDLTSLAEPTEEHQYDALVADMADAMFNSRSSSTNSMDFIFSSSMDEESHHKATTENQKE